MSCASASSLAQEFQEVLALEFRIGKDVFLGANPQSTYIAHDAVE